MVEKVQIYCLNFNNPERKNNMIRRFESLNLDCIFYDGVNKSDCRISQSIDDHSKKIWSCMYGHLDMIHKFYYDTDKEYGIFCEDDIFIQKNFTENLPKIVSDFKELNLDVLLLGYLSAFRITGPTGDFHMKEINKTDDVGMYAPSCLTYYSFPDYIWGTQMYMLSRSHSKYLLDTYYSEYAEQSITNNNMIPFSADHILTKNGNRALITPIVAIEDNSTFYDASWGGQLNFHNNCFNLHYEENMFIE